MTKYEKQAIDAIIADGKLQADAEQVFPFEVGDKVEFSQDFWTKANPYKVLGIKTCVATMRDGAGNLRVIKKNDMALVSAKITKARKSRKK
jgi:hypothetical protein